MIIDPENLDLPSPRGFLVLDGVNGAGKSTLLTCILKHLSGLGFPVIGTREPGASVLGKGLRRLLLESEPGTVSPLAELFLFGADRADHVKQVIQPGLASGQLVISDRYYYSTAAFQGYGRQLDRNTVNSINHLAIDGLLPDLLLLLDLEPEEGLRRNLACSAAAREKDSFEMEELEFHRRLRQGFLEVAAKCPEPVWVIDAAQDADSIWKAVAPVIHRWAQACRESACHP